MDKIEHILDFWFAGIDDQTDLSQVQEITSRWFKKDDAFDTEVRKNFEGDLTRARKGKYDLWTGSPRGSLALVLTLDQFPRNLYRHSEKAFENDLRALEICLRAIKQGFDEELQWVERWFLYLPFMHSENLVIQKKSLEFFGLLKSVSLQNHSVNAAHYAWVYDFAVKHYEIIQRFDRFPHRNPVLGRRSTSEEIEFLKDPQNSF